MKRWGQPTIRDLRRQNGGTLPASVDGGYPLIYLAADGFVFCPACAEAVLMDDGYDAADKPCAWQVHWEGAPEQCEHCEAAVESAYGDPGTAETGE